jgi:hypothetical protein
MPDGLREQPDRSLLGELWIATECGVSGDGDHEDILSRGCDRTGGKNRLDDSLMTSLMTNACSLLTQSRTPVRRQG